MIWKPVRALLGLDQDTAREDSVTLLKTMSVGGSGPEDRERGRERERDIEREI